MARRAVTVRKLAAAAGLDHDDTLLRLWDADLDIQDIDAPLTRTHADRAREVLGFTDPTAASRVAFWERQWALSPSETRDRMRDDFGIVLSSEQRKLPKGALRKLSRTLPGGGEPLPPQVDRLTCDEAEPEPAFEWKPRGHASRMKLLTAEEIERIHVALAVDFAQSPDPISPQGVKDWALLESAASRPGTALGGVRKYGTVEAEAAALLHSLVHNHAFHNGNKRTALVSMLVMLDRSGLLLSCSEKELFRFVLRVAQHRLVPRHWSHLADREVLAVCEWLVFNTRPLDRSERRLRWYRLTSILRAFGCRTIGPLPGNKLRVERDVKRMRLGIPRRQTLTFTAGYHSSGQEVEPTLVKELRRVLELDDDHGYDSFRFYGDYNREADEFISQYRTLLRRLAKV